MDDAVMNAARAAHDLLSRWVKDEHTLPDDEMWREAVLMRERLAKALLEYQTGS